MTYSASEAVSSLTPALVGGGSQRRRRRGSKKKKSRDAKKSKSLVQSLRSYFGVGGWTKWDWVNPRKRSRGTSNKKKHSRRRGMSKRRSRRSRPRRD